MRKTKEKLNNKGITLIALVVTIVVLLILAVISISMLTGENGIIKQANTAKTETRGGEVEEKVNLWKVEKNTQEYSNTETKTEEQLLEELLSNKLVYENELNRGEKTITIGSRVISYNLNEKYVPMEPDTGKEALILEYTLNAGDVVGLPYRLNYWDNEGNEQNAIFDFEIDWGDGEKDTITNDNIESKSKHTYSNSGIYEITITGTFEALSTYFWDEADETRIFAENINKLTKVKQWGTTNLKKIYLGEISGLKEIVTPTQGSFKNLLDASFEECEGLIQIPDKLFANCKNVTDFEEAFYGCTSLTTIGNNTFANCSNVTYFGWAFEDCTNLTTIGDNTFANCSNAMEFTGVFRDCTNLTTIGDNTFLNCSNVVDFARAFKNCTNLTTIGDNTFANCSNVTSFGMDDYENCFFESCTSLTTIGDNTFANCSNVTDFNYVFSGCTNLTTIGDNTFANCSNATDFYRTFYGCTNLTTIGDNTFLNCSNVTYFGIDYDEMGFFESCTSLTTIGDNTFANCSNVTDFSCVFSCCTNLTTIGPNTFKGCDNVESYEWTFYNCSSLTGQAIPLWILVENGEENGYRGIPNGRNCYNNCINLDDFEDIPEYWKTDFL